MKTMIGILIIAFFTLTLPGQTPVPAGDVFGTWDTVGSPYLIEGNITIPNGSTLWIKPGVKVEFQDSYTMFVQGRILAQGKETDSIVFTAADTAVGFNSIRFLGTPIENDTSKFDYCVFTYGRAHGPYYDNFGGALAFADFGKIIVDNCRFAYNRALHQSIVKPGGGAAIALLRCSPIIRNSIFEYNRGCIGAAVMLSTDSTLLENNIFRYNEAPYFDDYREGLGGAIFCKWWSHAVIRGNIFHGNHADVGAGAIYFWNNGNAHVENNIFYENESGGIGGAMRMDSCSSPTIINNTIVNNTAVEKGGGIDVYFKSNPEVYNTILWGNTAPEGSQLCITSNDCTPNFYYSDIQGGQSAFGGNPFTGNYIECIDTDPLFVETGEHPYALSDESPCIDRGTSDTTGLSLTCWDIIGNCRFWDGDEDGDTIIDIGAYEFDSPPWVSIDNISLFNTYRTQNLSICPNPFTNSATLSFRLSKPENVHFTVYNVQSKIVFEMQEKQEKGEQKVQWNADGLPAGMYYFRIQAGEKVGGGKMVKISDI